MYSAYTVTGIISIALRIMGKMLLSTVREVYDLVSTETTIYNPDAGEPLPLGKKQCVAQHSNKHHIGKTNFWFSYLHNYARQYTKKMAILAA